MLLSKKEAIKQAFLEYLQPTDLKGWYQAVHDFDVNNFDPEPLFWIIRNKECDKGTALMIYWLVLLYHNPTVLRTKENLLEGEKAYFPLINEIEDKYKSGFYFQSKIAYDPSENAGIITKESLPEAMWQPVLGEMVSCPGDFIEGMPEAVHERALELVGEDKWDDESEEEDWFEKPVDYTNFQSEYWCYREGLKSYGGGLIIPKMSLDRGSSNGVSIYNIKSNKSFAIRSATQPEPYGYEDFTQEFVVNPKWKMSDYQSAGDFLLITPKLEQVFRDFGVKFESFPATFVDKLGNSLSCNYKIFHLIEGFIDAMDFQKSGWKGDRKGGVKGIFFDANKFEHRPMFVLKYIYSRVMRDDLRREIIKQGLTGFAFLPTEKYVSGSYGFAPNFQHMP